jgi:hypothetical protein
MLDGEHLKSQVRQKPNERPDGPGHSDGAWNYVANALLLKKALR